MADYAHNHTPTFRRCLDHLKAEGFDEEGAHRICYSVHAGGEGAGATPKKESAEEQTFIGVSLLENSAAAAAGTVLDADLFEAALAESTVDIPNRIVKDLVLLGVESPTRRRSYSESARREALPLYGKAKFYLNHPPIGTEHQERDVRDLAAQVIEGTQRIDQQGRIRANAKVLKTAAGDTFLGIAESAPNIVGCSHNAIGIESPHPTKPGHTIIEKITSVRSVDIVTEPGTTKGLHESARTAPNTESLEMDPKLIAALTLSQLLMANPALVESIRKEAAEDVRTKEVKPLQEKVNTLESKLSTEAGTRIIEAVLAKHKELPKRTAEGIRGILKNTKDLTEAKAEAAVAEAKAYLKECGVDLDKAPKGKGKTTDVTESAASVPADGADGESTEDDVEDLRESMATLIGVSLDDEKDDEDDDKK